MILKSLCIVTILVVELATALPQNSQELAAQDIQTILEEKCRQRSSQEFFRLTTDGDCRDVVRCDRAGIAGTIRLASVKCPAGLAFDLFLQACDWKANVDNCDILSKPLKPKPIFNTAEAVCPDGDLQCANGNCIGKALFCNGSPDCSDGSDENACSVDEDPNKAEICNSAECELPDCFCSVDGTRAPGPDDREISSVPMMITITFNGAVNQENMLMYDKLFHGERLNPNGCTAKGTFFVSHKSTNYSAVQDLHRRGHEIGVFSITNNPDATYWTEGSYDTWLAEMAGSRLIIEQFANITDGTVVGIRAPQLLVGGNAQFQMMEDQFFAYDSSIVAPLSRVPIWPYTLHYRMPHKCHGNSGNCPSRSHPIWEMPINELDRRDDPNFDETLSGCHLVSSCGNINDPVAFKNFLQHNFERHYGSEQPSNRAPLSLSFDPSWLLPGQGVRKDFVNVLDKWMTEILTAYNDVYFVTELQVIQWIQDPVGVTSLRDYPAWKEKCTVKGQPFCSLPNPCPVSSRELPGETIRLHTCVECPSTYPWIQDPTGEGFSF